MVLAPIALACVWAGGWWFLALVSLAGAGLAVEWTVLCRYPPGSPWGIGLALVTVGASVCSAFEESLLALLIVVAGAGAAVLFAEQPVRARRKLPLAPGPSAGGNPAVAAGTGAAPPDWLLDPKLGLAFGFPYLGLAAVALPWLRADPLTGWPNMVFLLSVVWASDIGAYATGRLFGGPKLAPALSPGKTWSGAAGGLLSAGIAGLGVAGCLSSGISATHVAGLAIGFGAVSQAGDLLESALKRHFGVKDSGRLIPGHGGLLDRLDALLVVAPVTAVLVFSVGRGVVLWR